MKNAIETYERHLSKFPAERLTTFNCPSCKKQLKDVLNKGSFDWDSMAFCPYCQNHYFKVTKANNGPILTTKADQDD